MSEVLIGHIGVDSGQMMLCDPCYINGNWDTTQADFDCIEQHKDEFSYGGACQATLSEKKAGVLESGLGAVCATGYGDGSYPVYVRYNSEGRVVEMRIEFDSQTFDDYDDNDDEDEY